MTRRFLPGRLVERGIGVLALVLAVLGPLIFNGYWAHTLLTETFIMGTAAASLIFLSAYGGMVSLSQTALYGISGFIVGNLATKGGAGGETKGLHLGWDPTIAVVVAIVLTTAIGLVLGLVSARSLGIYFLMITLTFAVIANYFFGQVTNVSGFSGIGGINRYTPGWIGDVLAHPNHLYYAALIVAVGVYLLIRFIVRTPFGITLQGVRDEPLRMTSLGYNVPLHRALAFTFGAFIASLAGVLFVWWNGQIDPQTIGLQSTIDLLVIAVIGGLLRVEGAWLGAFAFIVINNEVRDVELPGIGGSFNTIIGLIFLAVVVVSPSGLMGIWDRVTRPTLGGWDRAVRRARVVETQKAGP
jgi:branched-chain amino acid transport system permease protein